MTQMPEMSESTQMTGPGAEGDESAPAFEAYLPSEIPRKKSRVPLVVMILGVMLLIGGVIFWSVEPEKAKAKKARPDFANMTAEQLAENASASAATELVRRMFHGTPEEQAAASSVMNGPKSPRLSRNLAIAMALEQKKRADEMMLRTQRDIRMAERGY